MQTAQCILILVVLLFSNLLHADNIFGIAYNSKRITAISNYNYIYLNNVQQFLCYDGYDTYKFFKATEYKDVAQYIVALEAIESGWGSSKRHNIKNNNFSIYMIKDGKAMMRPFNSKLDSLLYLYMLFKRKKYSTEPDKFLQEIYTKGYASELPDHPERLKKVGNNLYNNFYKYIDGEL